MGTYCEGCCREVWTRNTPEQAGCAAAAPPHNSCAARMAVWCCGPIKHACLVGCAPAAATHGDPAAARRALGILRGPQPAHQVGLVGWRGRLGGWSRLQEGPRPIAGWHANNPPLTCLFFTFLLTADPAAVTPRRMRRPAGTCGRGQKRSARSLPTSSCCTTRQAGCLSVEWVTPAAAAAAAAAPLPSAGRQCGRHCNAG